MRHSAIREDQWGVLRTCVADSERIRARCTRLVRDLKEVFENNALKESVGLSVELAEDSERDILAFLYSPIGHGRLRLGWSVDEEGLVGSMYVERKTPTPEDKDVWVPLSVVTVPGYSNPYVGAGEHRFPIYYDRMLGRDLPDSLFACGMSMLYSVSVDQRLV